MDDLELELQRLANAEPEEAVPRLPRGRKPFTVNGRNYLVKYGNSYFYTVDSYNRYAEKYGAPKLLKKKEAGEVLPSGYKLSYSSVYVNFVGDNYKWDKKNVDPTFEDYTKAIMEAMKARNNKYASLRILFKDSDDRYFTRNLALGKDVKITAPQLIAELNKMKENMEEYQGSDPLLYDDAKIDFEEFMVTFNVVAHGGNSNAPTFKKNHHAITLKLNGFIVNDFKSTNNDCLLSVLKAATGRQTKQRNDLIKQQMGLAKESPIDINQISWLEGYFSCRICVFESVEYERVIIKNGIAYDHRNANLVNFKTTVTTKNNILYGATNADCWVLLHNNHYYLIKDYEYKKFCPYSGLPIKENKEQATFKEIRKSLIEQKRLQLEDAPKVENTEWFDPYYYFFDYETFYDHTGRLIPYSVCCVAGRIENDKFVKEKEYSILKIDCTIDFIDWLLSNEDNLNQNFLIGYNSSRFDNSFFIDGLMKKNLISKNSLFLSGNSILGLRFKSFTCLDLCRILCKPLGQACIEMGVGELKSSFDHNEIQNGYYSADFNAFLEERRAKILEYNIQDCVCLAALYARTRKEIKYMLDLDINEFMTVSSLTFKKWQSEDEECKIPKDYETWQFIRKAAYGGRSEIFKRGKYVGHFQSFDVKSLYPYVMTRCSYPVGEEIKTDKYIDGKLGIYRCKIVKQPSCNIIPLRTDDKPLDWKYNSDFECVLSSVDINCIKDFGGIVEIYEGVYWEKSSKNVFKVLKRLEECKTNQDRLKENKDKNYNPCIRELCKLLLNSLSGKVIQRMFNKTTTLITSVKDEMSFSNKHDNITITQCYNSRCAILTGTKVDINYIKSAKPCQLGVFIYAWARNHMYRSILSRVGDNKFGMDTDAVHVDVDHFNLPNERGYGKFNEGGEFGDFEREISFNATVGYWIAPKCYCLKGDDGIKMRFKGLGRKDKLITMSEEDFKKLTIREQKDIYNSLPTALCEDLYKGLIDNGKVTVLCSQLKRTINTKDSENPTFSVSQVFMYKTITYHNM